MIKAAKKVIKTVATKADISDEELTTVFTGAEILTNSTALTNLLTYCSLLIYKM